MPFGVTHSDRDTEALAPAFHGRGQACIAGGDRRPTRPSLSLWCGCNPRVRAKSESRVAAGGASGSRSPGPGYLARLFRLEGVDQDLRGRAGRGRVLAGDQQPIGDDVDAPVLDFREGGTEAEQLVLDEERHDLGQADIRLLAVREPGHLLALDERLARGGLDVAQRAGGMANQRHVLAGGEEGLDQRDGTGVFGQVPHRAMAARIEDGVVVLLFYAVEAHRLVQLALGVVVLLEATG